MGCGAWRDWVDLSDVLVSSIPNCKDLQKFVDKEYKHFLLELNIYLRALQHVEIKTRSDVIETRVGEIKSSEA